MANCVKRLYVVGSSAIGAQELGKIHPIWSTVLHRPVVGISEVRRPSLTQRAGDVLIIRTKDGHRTQIHRDYVILGERNA